MNFIKRYVQGDFGLLKTFLYSNVAVIFYVIASEAISMSFLQVRGEFESAYTPLYFIAVLELLAIFLLISYWNAIKQFEGGKVWVYLSKLYAFFVLQCILLPLYISAYLIFLSEPIK
jgi:hypothetical protein